MHFATVYNFIVLLAIVFKKIELRKNLIAWYALMVEYWDLNSHYVVFYNFVCFGKTVICDLLFRLVLCFLHHRPRLLVQFLNQMDPNPRPT